MANVLPFAGVVASRRSTGGPGECAARGMGVGESVQLAGGGGCVNKQMQGLTRLAAGPKHHYITAVRYDDAAEWAAAEGLQRLWYASGWVSGGSNRYVWIQSTDELPHTGSLIVVNTTRMPGEDFESARRSFAALVNLAKRRKFAIKTIGSKA